VTELEAFLNVLTGGTREGNAEEKKCLSEDTVAIAVQCIFIIFESQSLVDKSNYSIPTTFQNAFL